MGGTFVIGANGDVLIGDGYSSNFLQITPSGSSDTILAAGVGASNAALDSYGNLYFGGNYNANIFKIPYVSGAYVGWASGSTPTANCKGGNQDTTPCIFAPAISTFVNSLGGSGFAGVAFDAAGNFFFETNTLPTTTPNSIFECDTSCISNSSATPKLLYSDSNPVGAFQIDPWGNIFFVDGNNSKGKNTNLNELALSSGSYATSPAVVLSYTNAAGYGNGISGLAISGTGTIFISTNGDGLFAIPNTQTGGPNINGTYMLASQGGKGVAVDSEGNLYGIPYNSGDVVSYIPVNNFSLGSEAIGTAATAVSATIFDSSGTCTPALTATASHFGVTSTDFTVTAGTSCSAAFGGSNGTFTSGPLTAAGFSSISVTLNFTPTAAGARNAALVTTDSTNGAGGVAALSGVGQGAKVNVDPGATTTFTTGLSNPTAMIADAAGNVFIADAGNGKVYEISGGTMTQIGSGLVAPQGLAFDASGDLFIADNGLLGVVEIPNTGTTGAFAAGTQTTVIAPTTLFGGEALGSVSGLAIGPNGTLYISDPVDHRVVYYNLVNSQSGVTPATSANGISAPAGLAVDSSGVLYVADSSNDQIFEFTSAGGIEIVTPPNITNASGVGVDASGSLLISDLATGNIERIPGEVIVETLPTPATSLWMDGLGDLYVTSGSAKSAYAIQRTAASINLGTVADGATNSGTIYLTNAGNEAGTLANPDLTQPTNTMFLLAAAGTNGCVAGASGAAGSLCAFTATFAPPAGSNDSGPFSDSTGAILIGTPSLSIPVTISGTASVSSLQPQTITYSPALPATGYVGQQITLSATATSGLTVALASVSPSVCTLSSATSPSTATFVGTGTCIINANQAGGNNNSQVWGAAPQVTTNIKISNVTAAGVPALFMTQTTSFPSLLTGGILAGPIAAGTSIGVGNNGYVAVSETYGGSVAIYNLAAGTVAALGSFSNPGGVTADSQGNLYISGQYNNQIAKLPFAKGAYAALTSITSSTPTCSSTTTGECVLGPVASVSSIGGIAAMTFDSQGNLFFGTDNQGSTQFSIWECTAACLSTGTPAPAMIFQEPAGADPVHTGQLYIGALGVDPWGNLFFTDSNLVNEASSSANNEATLSDVYELPLTSGKFAATPTLLQTYTNGTPGGYDDNLDALTVAPSGTVYYATLYDGVYAIPNTQSGGPVIAGQYPVSGSGAKALGVDANGNLYEVSGGLSEIAVGDMTMPTAQYEGAPVTASVAVVDTAIGYCGATPNLLFAASNPTEFSATASTKCSGLSAGSSFKYTSTAGSFPATITFTPLSPNAQTSTLAISDTANGGTGSATVSALAQTTPQSISFTAPTTTTYTYAAPPNPVTITLTVANGASNNPVVFTVDAASSGAGTLSATTVSGTNSSATLTVTQAGAITIDANEAGGLVSSVYYQDAPQIQLALTVNQASQSITFTPVAGSPFTYSASPQVTIQLSATGGASGNPVTFSIDPTSTGAGTVSASTQVGTASLATLTVTQAGSIVIDAAQAATTDYAAASLTNAQTVQVNQAAQTITFIPPAQPIHFITTSTGIAGGIAVQISATGGASNNAIVFTVDKSSTMTGSISTSTVSGATSTATLTIPVQTATSGNIVIDATQPANTDYAAVTVTPLATLTILPPLPLQTITWPNPGTQVSGNTLALTGTASSAFPVTYTSTTTSVCTVSNTTATFVTAGTCTITATQPGDNVHFAAAPPVTQSFTVNAKGQNPAIALNLTLNSLTLQPGTVGTSNITLTSQNNFTGSVVFSCSGLPSGYACNFTPTANSANPVIVQANQSTSITIVIGPTGIASLERGSRPFAPLATLAAALILIGFRKRNRIFLVVLITLGVVGMSLFSGCSGSSSVTTQSTTSSVTVTATATGMSGASGSVSQNATMSVTVQ